MSLLALAMLLLHPVHETVAEIQWNPDSGRMEVAMRLHALDRQWLEKRYRRDRTEQQWAVEYLRQRFRVTPRPPQGEPDATKYHWLGRQRDGAHVWWFFEIEPPENQRPQQIEHQVLFDREPNYTHRVLVLEGQERRSIELTHQRPKQPLSDANDK